jgi:chemosensory pili system protein ChpA (sensor histidine kinase/response regulator)
VKQNGEDYEMSQLIMVVDDSPVVRKIIEVVLTRAGYEVVAVPDGVEALRALLAPGARLPDLSLLDLVMPRMDGFGLALQIKERPHLKAIPLVVLSRRVSVLDRLLARLCGVRAYLPKPLKEQQILALAAAFVGPAHKTVQQGQVPASYVMNSNYQNR